MTNKKYHELITPYQDAMSILIERIQLLDHSLYEESDMEQKAIHHIESRIKSQESIEEKLKKQNLAVNKENAMETLKDIAGIRVVCFFESDIYKLVDVLKRQNIFIWIKEKNYIKNPKPNGYRSFHVILAVPLYYLDVTEYFPVEIQFRSMAMDLWASMEHRICYKKDKDGVLREEFIKYAEELEQLEKNFQENMSRMQEAEQVAT